MSISEPTQRGFPTMRAGIVCLLIAVALGLRLWGIGKESFWTDEVFSVQYSEGGIAEVLQKNAAGTHPPLFHLGLHFWRAAAGDSDGGIRGYSVVWSMLGLLAVFVMALEFGGWRTGLIALILATVSPLHVYFAQEARPYSQAMAMCVLSAWCLWRWIGLVAQSREAPKWWPWAVAYTLCATAALGTHYVCAIILLAQGVFALVWFARRRQWASVWGYVACALATTLLFAPWLVYVLNFRSPFYHDILRWVPTAKPSDYYSFLGREMVWGCVKRIHMQWWIPTIVLSVFVLILSARPLYARRAREVDSLERQRRTGVVYLLWLLFGPVLVAGLAHLANHPVFWRSKFSMLILPPFLILSAIACGGFRRRWMTVLATAALGGIMLWGTVVQQRTYQKIVWRVFPRVWREKGPPAGAVFFPPGLEICANRYLETPIVSPNRATVEYFLPKVEKAEIWICFWWRLDFGSRGTSFDYYQWLLSLGPVRQIRMPTSLALQAVTIGEPPAHESVKGGLDRWFAPFDLPGRIEGFRGQSGFSILEIDGETTTSFRWSGPKARFCLPDSDRVSTVVLNVQLPPPVPSDFRPALRLYAKRGKEATGLFDTKPIATIDNYRVGAFHVALPVPQGTEPLWIGWIANTVNLGEAGVSGDDRDLGLRVNWVGTQNASD